MILFHGGCHGCTRQDAYTTEGCWDCCYFDADWNLPSLNNEPPTAAEIERNRLKSIKKQMPQEPEQEPFEVSILNSLLSP
jgi:hypothetical protein